MKNFIFSILFTVFAFSANAQTDNQKAQTQQSTIIKNKIVEIACGECKFKMTGKSCDLAVRIDGKPYFVDGKHIDDFGDAHDEKHGFCNAISKAKVSGEIVEGRFKAKKIELIHAKD
jgi:hypothetical protein